LMATVAVAVSSDLCPEPAWALASDLRRFEEWLTIFGWLAQRGSVSTPVGRLVAKVLESDECKSVSSLAALR
jgi:hypothetical protein